MSIPVRRLSRQWGLSDLEEMRLVELKTNYPKTTSAMLEADELRGYLASWRQSAEAYLASLMDPNNPASAWRAVGATRELRETDPERWTRRSKMVEPTARDMMIREMVLAPLPGAQD